MFKVIWNGKTIKEFKTKERAKVFMNEILLDKYDMIRIKEVN